MGINPHHNQRRLPVANTYADLYPWSNTDSDTDGHDLATADDTAAAESNADCHSNSDPHAQSGGAA